MALLPLTVWGDGARLLDGLGLQFQVVTKASVSVLPYPDQRLWVNGIRIFTHDVSKEGYVMRVGDRIDEWESELCYRYHFDQLEGKVGTFTRSTYISHRVDIGNDQSRLSSGPLIRKETFTVDLAQFEIVDYDPIMHLEAGDAGVYRSKSP